LLEGESAFWSFLQFSDWLYEKLGSTFGISARKLGAYLAEFLRDERGVESAQILLDKDRNRQTRANLPQRQARHLETRKA